MKESFRKLLTLVFLVSSFLTQSSQAAFLKNSPSFVLLSTPNSPTMVTHSTAGSRFSTAASLDTGDILERTKNMDANSMAGAPLTESELDNVIRSIQNITPSSSSNIDYDDLRTLLSNIAHLSHKDWTMTGDNAIKLGQVLLPLGMCTNARQMFTRILTEGNWDGAQQHAQVYHTTTDKPWAVLVTGVNGIRKTTSMYQPWFPALLAEAITPKNATTVLPCGDNSFFRQLDHMIATLCNEDFSLLYALTEQEMTKDEEPSKELIQKYSNLKAAIFTRYRTLSELLGACLLREAQKLKSNCMMETSGRDVAMFHYVDHFFPKEYNKLALHFTVSDLSCAQQSVDARMIRELKDGIEALKSNSVSKVINANAGGPYGSEVLPGVQEASDRVWNDVVLKGDEVGQDWYKATIAINAHATEPWTAQAVRPDGTLGTMFTFENR